MKGWVLSPKLFVLHIDEIIEEANKDLGSLNV